jgi:hypothetical protein
MAKTPTVTVPGLMRLTISVPYGEGRNQDNQLLGLAWYAGRATYLFRLFHVVSHGVADSRLEMSSSSL